VTDISVLLAENPVILWGGLILAAVIFVATRYLENMGQEEYSTPRPSTLDAIVKPRIKEQIEMRGIQPPATEFKIGREIMGTVDTYVDTKMPNVLMNPNPNKNKQSELENLSEDDFVDVRVIKTNPTGVLNKFVENLKLALTNPSEEEEVNNWSFYIFRKDSFLDVPGNDMVLDPNVLSYNYAGMEVEIDDATRNVVNAAVSTEVSEKVLAALPNYTEKVDYLFPIHSQKMTGIEKEGEHLRDNDGF